MQQGPGEILVAMKRKLKSGIDSDTLVGAIHRFETSLAARISDVKRSFIDPDHGD